MVYTRDLNKKILRLRSSPTLKITSVVKRLKADGEDVIIFAAGEPDFDTPDFIKEAAIKALKDGFTKYTPSSGLIELKRALVQKLKDENNLDYFPENILVTAGAKYALFISLLSLIDSEEDEVIIPSPYWVSYPEMVTLAGGKVKILPTRKKDGFKITPQTLKESINLSSKVLILNYPSNPTGVTYTRDELVSFWEIIRKNSLVVLCDEIYEKLLFDGLSHTSFASLGEEAYQRTLTVNGFSKSFSMTGWRLGYVAGPEDVIKHISKIIDHTTSCPTSFAQKGALAALSEGGQWVGTIRDEFESRRDLICGELASCKGIEVIKPQGTFYVFCDITGTGMSSMDFASKLLEEHRVAVIPSDGFGIEGYVRMSFSTSRENIKKGVSRIRTFLKERG